MNKELAKSIGVAARQARTALELTQEDAAERIGVSVEFYARIERGNSLPSVPTLARIAAVLGVSADALLGRKEFVPGATPAWLQAAPPDDTPELRRVLRLLRRSEQGTRRLVGLVLKELDRRGQGGGDGDGGGAGSEPDGAADATPGDAGDDIEE